MSVFKDLPSAPPLEGLEVIAAKLLSELYVSRVQSIVTRQLAGEVGPNLLLSFTERLYLGPVVQALKVAQAKMLKEACWVAIQACDAAKGGSKESRTARTILDELKALAPPADEPAP